VFDPSRTASRSYLPGVKIALAAAHFHSVGVALAGPWDTVENTILLCRITQEPSLSACSQRLPRLIWIASL